MKRIVVLIISLLLLNSCLSHVVFGPEDLDKNLVNDPRIRTGVLDNGLRYVIRVNKNPEKKAEFRFGVNVGSLLESEDEQGVAHFIEHMAFNGTRHFSQRGYPLSASCLLITVAINNGAKSRSLCFNRLLHKPVEK